jgi:hypothetical protein
MLYVGFLGMFALDVFNEHLGFARTALALAMHLIPSAIALVPLVIAWRYPRAGALGYLAAAAFYCIRMSNGRISWMLVIAGPIVVVAALFWFSRRKVPAV